MSFTWERKNTYIFAIIASILIIPISTDMASAESVPEWIKNNALWYGQDIISENEFLNAIKFLIENDIIVLDKPQEKVTQVTEAVILIPNGN